MGGLRLDEIAKLKEFESSITIGLVTLDFSLIHDIASELEDSGIGLALIGPGEHYEGHTDAVIFDKGIELPVFEEGEPPLIPISDSFKVDIDRAVITAMGKYEPESLVIGIDPGKRPGVAFLADGRLVKIHRSYGGHDIKATVMRALKAYGPQRTLLRIGDGDPDSRNRIIDELLDLSLQIEIVDERRTSTSIRFRDELAALKIARNRGSPLK